MIWNIQILNKLWKFIKERKIASLTKQKDEAKKELTWSWKKADWIVKAIVHGKYSIALTMGYSLVLYFVIPVVQFILPRYL